MDYNGGWLWLSKLRKNFNARGWGEPLIRGHKKLRPFIQTHRPDWVIEFDGSYYLKKKN